MAALDGKGAMELLPHSCIYVTGKQRRQLKGLLVGATNKCIGECNSSKTTQHALPCIHLVSCRSPALNAPH
jgi:hypothetical protein